MRTLFFAFRANLIIGASFWSAVAVAASYTENLVLDPSKGTYVNEKSPSGIPYTTYIISGFLPTPLSLTQNDTVDVHVSFTNNQNITVVPGPPDMNIANSPSQIYLLLYNGGLNTLNAYYTVSLTGVQGTATVPTDSSGSVSGVAAPIAGPPVFDPSGVLIGHGPLTTSALSFNGMNASFVMSGGPNTLKYFDIVANPAQKCPVSTSGKICFSGYDSTNTLQSNLDVTFNPSAPNQNIQQAVVGQQINLSAQVPGTVQSQKWIVQGKPIGGAIETATSEKIIKLATGASSTTFYWTVPTADASSSNTPYKVTYEYTLTNAQKGKIESEFNVTGPSPSVVASAVSVSAATITPSNDVTTRLGNVQILDNTSGLYPDYGLNKFLACGNVDTTPCITFTLDPSLASEYSGFEWLQLIEYSNSIHTRIIGGTQKKCVYGAGLDNQDPYSIRSQTSDSPDSTLSTIDSRFERTFKAQMFLMFRPPITNSIRIPLGNLEWSWSGTAVGIVGWSLQSFSGPTVDTPFHASNLYPQWNKVDLNGTCPT